MLRDEYNRLLDLFAQSAEGKPVNIEDLFKQALEFFEQLKVQLKTGTEEDRKEAIRMMGELYTRMIEHSKKMSAKTGLSEEQLAAFADNPSNFSPEQWQSIQEAKAKMLHTGQDLAKVVNQLHPPKQSDEPPREKGKKEPHPKKPKRSQWMRS